MPRIPKESRWQPTDRTLGEGGQGMVQLVTDKEQQDSPRYALKILKQQESPQAYQRFYREVEAIKRVASKFKRNGRKASARRHLRYGSP